MFLWHLVTFKESVGRYLPTETVVLMFRIKSWAEHTEPLWGKQRVTVRGVFVCVCVLCVDVFNYTCGDQNCQQDE